MRLIWIALLVSGCARPQAEAKAPRRYPVRRPRGSGRVSAPGARRLSR